MMQADYFSQWLGIQVLELEKGCCKLQMKVRKEMLNGFGIAHGGITYCLSDSALAFSSNSHGKQCVSIETSISHTAKVLADDILTAVAKELQRGNKTGIYEVTVTNQHQHMVSHFKGTVFITDKIWE